MGVYAKRGSIITSVLEAVSPVWWSGSAFSAVLADEGKEAKEAEAGVRVPGASTGTARRTSARTGTGSSASAWARA